MKTTSTIHWNKGVVSEKHNERDEDLCKNEEHIDLYNKHGDSYHETWYQSDLREKYIEIFGEALEEYNAKRRKDRRMDIDEYMQSVLDDKRGKRQTKKVNDGKRVIDEDAKRQGKQLSYEITVKVGNTYRKKDKDNRVMYDSNGHHIREEELPRDLQKTILKRYCDTFQEANPNFRVVNIHYHADEGFYNRKGVWEYDETHPQIEIIPVAHGFKKGLSVQNSMNKAMAEMGFTTSDCYNEWAKKEQERLEVIMHEEYEKYCKANPDFFKEKGYLDIYHPVADKTREGGKSKEEIAHEQELEEREAEVKYKVKQLNEREKDLKAKEKDLQAMYSEAEDNFKTAKDEADSVLDAVLDLHKQIQDDEIALNARETSLKAREDDLVTKQEDFTLEKENWLKTQNTALEDERKKLQDEQKEQALSYLRRKKKLDEENEIYKAELKAKSDRQMQEYKQTLQQQVQDFCEQVKKDMTAPYKRSGRAIPEEYEKMFKQMQEKADGLELG